MLPYLLIRLVLLMAYCSEHVYTKMGSGLELEGEGTYPSTIAVAVWLCAAALKLQLRHHQYVNNLTSLLIFSLNVFYFEF